MPLVGELIVRCRNMAGDPCQTLPAPVTPSLSTSGAGNLSGTLFGIETWTNQYGETVGGAEVTIAGLSNNAVFVNDNLANAGVTGGRFYYTTSGAGTEVQYITLTNGGTNTVGLASNIVLPGQPPYKSSAYLPDTDGDIVSTYEMYRWINAGLTQLGRLVGGILDQTGVAMPAGAAEVVIPGWWLSFKYFWHNGWLVLPENQSYTWLQSPVQGIPGISTIWKNSAQQVVGTWPQPSTAPTATTLTAAMGATDTLANVVNAAGFTSPGMCQIDSEIMSYSQSNTTVTPNQLTGIVRGYSGTIASPHAMGAPVTQLILRLLGRRMPVMLVPGQGNNTLDLPMGWDAVLEDYIMAQFKQTEQDTDAAAKLMASFKAKAVDLRDDSIPLESKQVGGLFPLGGAAQTLAEVMDSVIVQ